MHNFKVKKKVIYLVLFGICTSVIATVENEKQESVVYLLWFLVRTYYSKTSNNIASIVSLFLGITAATTLRCCMFRCKKKIKTNTSRKNSIENQSQNFNQGKVDLFDSEATKKFLEQYDC